MSHLNRARSITALAHGAHIDRMGAKRTYLHPAHMRLTDWMLLILVLVYIAAVIVMMVVFGW